MKKVLLISLVVLCCFLFSSCGEPEPTSLCILLDISTSSSDAAEASSAMDNFLVNLGYSGIELNAEIELLPTSGSDRAAALQRVRTEIVSGKGPDIFIVSGEGRSANAEPLFRFPECAMDDGHFLALDSFIENAQFMEWDKLTPAVMEAGRTEEGQMLLPLTYTFPVTMFRKEEANVELSPALTWDDALHGNSLFLKAAATRGGYWGSEYLNGILGQLADYPAEELLFTEEELLQRVKESLSLREAMEAGALDGLPSHYSIPMRTEFDRDTVIQKYGGGYDGIRPDEPLAMVPLYSRQGGCTATIITYCGINRNTKFPEEAFTVLDMLLSRDVQAKSAIYQKLLFGGVPTNEEVLQKEYSTSKHWYMNGESFASFCEARSQITSANFGNLLSKELFEMYQECSWRMKEEDLESLVEETYRILTMELAES